MDHITREQITQIVENNFAKQRSRLLEDLRNYKAYIVDNDHTYDDIKAIVIAETHMKNVLIDSLTDLCVHYSMQKTPIEE